jgi:hypothetical protein
MENNNVRTIKVLIKSQALEWYGDDDHIGVPTKGRYKPKYGSDFIVEVEERLALYGEELIKEAFNKEHNVDGHYFKYKALDVELYSKPQEITLRGL